MKIFLYFVPLLLVLARSIRCAPNISYDHIQLVQTWPPTFCLNPQVKCIKPLPQYFTLHGLWPADSDGDTLRNCSSRSNFNHTTLYNELAKELAAAWPSIRKDVPNDKFWDHEWREHGTCSESKIDARPYFEAAIRERKKINLLNALKEANIIPTQKNSTAVYKKSAIESAIKKAIGNNNDVYVSCSIHNNNVLLHEIYICLDDEAKNYVSCPKNKDTRGCGGVGKQSNIKFHKP